MTEAELRQAERDFAETALGRPYETIEMPARQVAEYAVKVLTSNRDALALDFALRLVTQPLTNYSSVMLAAYRAADAFIAARLMQQTKDEGESA